MGLIWLGTRVAGRGFAPLIGATDGRGGGSGLRTAYVKPDASVPAVVSGFVTTIFTTPDPCAGVVAVIVFASTTMTPVAANPSKVTVALGWKPAP